MAVTLSTLLGLDGTEAAVSEALPQALVDCLRSDGDASRAREARLRLLRGPGAEARPLLLEAVRSDDTQQAVEAAFVLGERGEARAALDAAPDIVVRAAAAFLDGSAGGSTWAAGHVMLRIGALLTPTRLAEAYGRVLRGEGASWSILANIVRVRDLCRELRMHFPAPLLRIWLRELREAGAREGIRSTAQRLGAVAVPALREILFDDDVTMARLSMRILLEMEVTDLPRGCAPILVEVLAADSRALERLCAMGLEGSDALEAVLGGRNRRTALRAARGLVRLDAARWAPEALLSAVEGLEDGDAREAAEFLVTLGDLAEPALRRAMGSADELVAVAAAAVLAVRGRLEGVTGGLFDRLFRLASRASSRDERGALLQLCAAVPGLWQRLEARLEASGAAGARRAVDLRTERVKTGPWPWLNRPAGR